MADVRCQNCLRDYPADIMAHPLIVEGERLRVCPRCANSYFVAEVGRPLQGEIACEMYRRAVETDAKRGRVVSELQDYEEGELFGEIGDEQEE